MSQFMALKLYEECVSPGNDFQLVGGDERGGLGAALAALCDDDAEREEAARFSRSSSIRSSSFRSTRTHSRSSFYFQRDSRSSKPSVSGSINYAALSIFKKPDTQEEHHSSIDAFRTSKSEQQNLKRTAFRTLTDGSIDTRDSRTSRMLPADNVGKSPQNKHEQGTSTSRISDGEARRLETVSNGVSKRTGGQGENNRDSRTSRMLPADNVGKSPQNKHEQGTSTSRISDGEARRLETVSNGVSKRTGGQGENNRDSRTSRMLPADNVGKSPENKQEQGTISRFSDAEARRPRSISSVVSKRTGGQGENNRDSRTSRMLPADNVGKSSQNKQEQGTISRFSDAEARRRQSISSFASKRTGEQGETMRGSSSRRPMSESIYRRESSVTFQDSRKSDPNKPTHLSQTKLRSSSSDNLRPKSKSSLEISSPKGARSSAMRDRRVNSQDTVSKDETVSRSHSSVSSRTSRSLTDRTSMERSQILRKSTSKTLEKLNDVDQTRPSVASPAQIPRSSKTSSVNKGQSSPYPNKNIKTQTSQPNERDVGKREVDPRRASQTAKNKTTSEETPTQVPRNSSVQRQVKSSIIRQKSLQSASTDQSKSELLLHPRPSESQTKPTAVDGKVTGVPENYSAKSDTRKQFANKAEKGFNNSPTSNSEISSNISVAAKKQPSNISEKGFKKFPSKSEEDSLIGPVTRKPRKQHENDPNEATWKSFETTSKDESIASVTPKTKATEVNDKDALKSTPTDVKTKYDLESKESISGKSPPKVSENELKKSPQNTSDDDTSTVSDNRKKSQRKEKA